MRLVLIFVSVFFQLNGQQAKMPSLLHLDSSDLALFQQRLNNDYMAHATALKELVKADTAKKTTIITPLQYKIVRPNSDSIYLKFNDILELQDNKMMTYYLFFVLDGYCLKPFYAQLSDTIIIHQSNFIYSNISGIDSLNFKETRFFTIECKAGIWFFHNDELWVLSDLFLPRKIWPAGKYVKQNYHSYYFDMTFNIEMEPWCALTHFPIGGMPNKRKCLFRKKYKKKNQ